MLPLLNRNLKLPGAWFSQAAYPERVLQFGEGVFLRGYLDWMIQEMNRQGLFQGSVLVVKPRPHGAGIEELNAQEGLFTLWTRGRKKGQDFESLQVVDSINRGINPALQWHEFAEAACQPALRFVFSNTTEAGLAYTAEPYQPGVCPAGYPAKLTAFLFERYRAFSGQADKGMLILPLELIEDNGAKLKAAVLKHATAWRLEPKFLSWVENSNRFFNTLVDRIVPGKPAEMPAGLAYEDLLPVACEPYHLLVVEAAEDLGGELPLSRAGLNVRWVPKLAPYRDLKVRILNGAHSFMALLGFLQGCEFVGDCLKDPAVLAQVKALIYGEVAPLLDVAPAEATAYADSVLERFANPFLKHALASIALNSVSKFKVRLLPSLLAHARKSRELPPMLVLALAGLFVFHNPRAAHEVKEQPENTAFFTKFWEGLGQGKGLEELCEMALGNVEFWGADLSAIPGLKLEVAKGIGTLSLNAKRQ